MTRDDKVRFAIAAVASAAAVVYFLWTDHVLSAIGAALISVATTTAVVATNRRQR